jgi:hypothetical protein
VSKVHICDACGKVIDTWQRVKYTENYIERVCEFGSSFTVERKRKVRVEMCKPCHDEFMDYLIARAEARKANPKETNDA